MPDDRSNSGGDPLRDGERHALNDGARASADGSPARGRKRNRAAPDTRPETHLGPIQDETTQRERFDPQELAIVLSHYDIGVIESVRDYPRGSRRAPKARIRSREGEFLLKRRAPGRDDPYRVAFSHRLQLTLAEYGFPVAHLIGTRDDNNSMVQHGGRVYELFEYVRGTFFSGSNREAQYSGFTLAGMHEHVGAHEIIYNPPEGSYHAAPGIDAQVAAIPKAITTIDVEAIEADVIATCSFLKRAYHDAVDRACDLGFDRWKRIIVHGDWHPGNILFDGERKVRAVLDFDSARLEPRVADIANGALQFSMVIGEPMRPETWPEGLSADRIRAFVRGYDQGAAVRLADDECRAVPWLIIEALIAESVAPLAATGRFARIPGRPFLKMIERKVKWIEPRADKLFEFLKEAPA